MVVSLGVPIFRVFTVGLEKGRGMQNVRWGLAFVNFSSPCGEIILISGQEMHYAIKSRAAENRTR